MYMINNKDSIKFPTKKALYVDFVSTLLHNAKILVFHFAFGSGGLETISSDIFGNIRTSSENRRKFFEVTVPFSEIPVMTRRKSHTLDSEKSWQAYKCNYCIDGTGVNVDLIELKTPDIHFC